MNFVNRYRGHCPHPDPMTFSFNYGHLVLFRMIQSQITPALDAFYPSQLFTLEFAFGPAFTMFLHNDLWILELPTPNLIRVIGELALTHRTGGFPPDPCRLGIGLESYFSLAIWAVGFHVNL